MSPLRRSFVLSAAVALSPPWARAVQFASYVSYSQGTVADPNLLQYDDAAAIGTPPAGTTGAPEGYPGVVSPFYPEFDPDQIVVIGTGGQLTLQFPSAISAGGGPQIGVFSNAGLIDSNYPAAIASSPAAVFGGGIADVSVSADDSHWTDLGLMTFNIPENFYLNAGPYDIAAPQSPQTADFGQAFTGTLASFNGESYPQILATLNGSAGGSWLNLYSSGLSQVNYLRISEPASLPAGSYLAIEAVSMADTLAPTASWSGGSGSWATGNWTGGVVPQHTEDVAIFGASSSAVTVTLDGNRTVGNLVFNSTHPYTIAPGSGGELILDNGPLPASIQVTGNHVISAPLRANGPVSLTGTGTLAITTPAVLNTALTIQSGATLDVTTAGFTVAYTSADPIAAIVSALTTGYAHGTWNGTGIVSSSAAAQLGHTSVGYVDNGNQIAVDYTINGDAYLTGSVGFADLLVVAQNYETTGHNWAGGNFTYDPAGSVGFADLLIIAQNYQAHLQNLSLTEARITAVPEPSGAGLLFLAGFLPLRRRTKLL